MDKENSLLPNKPNCLNVFDKVSAMQLVKGNSVEEILSQNEEEFLRKTMYLYFRALVEYFFSLDDECIDKVILIPFFAITHGMVELTFAKDAKEIADHYGNEEIEEFLQKTAMNVEAFMVHAESSHPLIKNEITALIFFADYFLTIKNNPVLAQAYLIEALSLVRDDVNNVGLNSSDYDRDSKYSKPEDSSTRSDAAVAYYLTTLIEQGYDLAKIKVPAKLIAMQKKMGKKAWKKLDYRDLKIFNTNYLATGLSSN